MVDVEVEVMVMVLVDEGGRAWIDGSVKMESKS